MRIKYSQMALLIGTAVGLLGLWAGAAPMGMNGDLITGAWSNWFSAWQGGEEWYVACSTSYCLEHTNAEPVWLYCGDGPNAGWGNCKGSYFIGAEWNGGSGTTVHSSEVWRICDGPTGEEAGFWFCEYYLSEADFY